MFNKIRSLLQEDYEPASGEFELDETYIGARKRGKRGRGAGGKRLCLVSHKGRVRSQLHLLITSKARL